MPPFPGGEGYTHTGFSADSVSIPLFEPTNVNYPLNQPAKFHQTCMDISLGQA